MDQRVDFFIIGVQKGGTTALAAHLGQHPQIAMSRVKEVHHFDDETHVDWSAPDHARLHAQFDWTTPHLKRGEATPITIFWPPALPRLHAYNPAAQLIVCLRHPVHRAYSQWRMEHGRKLETLSFAEAISDAGRARARATGMGVHRVFSYLERGFYAPQIERLLTMFPRSEIHFLRTDHMWLHLSGTLQAIETFLGLDAHLAGSVQQRYIVPVPPAPAPPLPAELATRLLDLYTDDIRKTGQLTGLSLADWFDLAYCEPMPTG
ncbi:sulfotransferase domain-containing protein [Hyphomonas sp.]|uniref:sulfotransferase domain-containing protein n=1 Tax=Hyphomonas sp. TaxID=87 RepID=UPI00391C8F9C